MVKAANFKPSVLIYNWKLQSEAEEVISGYAKQQREHNYGPFFYYEQKILEEIFNDISPSIAAKHSFEIEKKLESYAVDAEEALHLIRKGVQIGHTVTVIEGMLQ